MTRTYDPAQVIVTFGGAPIAGFADGTFISVEQNEDSFSLLVGADGDSCRAKTKNESARITLTLMQSSLSNDLLSALHNLDINSPGGDGILPFLMKDLTGTTICTCEQAWIVKPPAVSYGREPENREWVLETGKMIWGVGGNL